MFGLKKRQERLTNLRLEAEAKQEADKIARIKTIELALSKTAFTPDVSYWANKIGTIIFVYNDLMKRRRDHAIMADHKFAGAAYTDFDVNCWYRKKDMLPIALRPQIVHHKPAWSMQKNAHAATLRGELYVIPSSLLYDLDVYHMNTVQTVRQRVDIYLPYENEIENKDRIKVKTGLYHIRRKVWAWIGNPTYWWGETDPEGLGFARAVPYNDTWKNGADHYINNLDFTPMPIYTPRKSWKELYYYHAEY